MTETNLAEQAERTGGSGGAPDPIRPYFDTVQKADFPHVFGSTLCRAEHFLLPLFSYWCGEMKVAPAMHRKLWELVFIMQTLYEFDLLRPGVRGLGFGVGQEPLSTYWAKRGVEVVATDLDLESARAAGWADSGQHAQIPDHLFWPGITDRETFDRHVSFRIADMNRIPNDFTGFDFCWSACSLEHTGSIDKGLVFMENCLQTLRPGGVAVHTTEFNLSSDTDTIEEGGTVLFRKQDILILARLLRARGHKLLPLSFYSGATEIDSYVDLPPYQPDPHLRLRIGEYNSTSIGLAVVKGEA
jgi:SAM-dependent methyltransferase